MSQSSIKVIFAACCFMFFLNACKKDDPKTSVPTISSLNITAITIGTAEAGGNVTSDGGAAVIARGVCYSSSVYPTIATDKTTDGSGTGQFASSLISLTPGTLYSLRAYATNSAGTGYGEVVTFVTSPLVLGDAYGGGKAAHILQPGEPGHDFDQQHGIIVAASDQGTFNWGAYGATGATSTALGQGTLNTEIIVSSLGAGSYAAKACESLVLQGFSDWYLPTVAELNAIYLNKDIIGGFTGTEEYWTSSEFNSNLAWLYQFGIGSYIALDKLSQVKPVRAVRSF